MNTSIAHSFADLIWEATFTDDGAEVRRLIRWIDNYYPTYGGESLIDTIESSGNHQSLLYSRCLDENNERNSVPNSPPTITTLLQFAAAYGRSQALSILLADSRFRAIVDLPHRQKVRCISAAPNGDATSSTATPLALAVRGGHSDAQAMLLKAGADSEYFLSDKQEPETKKALLQDSSFSSSRTASSSIWCAGRESSSSPSSTSLLISQAPGRQSSCYQNDDLDEDDDTMLAIALSASLQDFCPSDSAPLPPPPPPREVRIVGNVMTSRGFMACWLTTMTKGQDHDNHLKSKRRHLIPPLTNAILALLQRLDSHIMPPTQNPAAQIHRHHCTDLPLHFCHEFHLDPTITSIGDNFLTNNTPPADCSRLIVSVHLGFPSLVQKIGICFMAGSSFLRHADLSGCQDLEVLPELFLYNCAALESVHFPPKLKRIRKSALANCPALAKLEQLPPTVREIDPFFLVNAKGLEEVDLSNLCRLPKLGDSFCCGCVSLKRFVFPFRLEKIGREALVGCTALSDLALPPYVTDIDEGFLKDCVNLTAVDFGLCDKLVSIAASGFVSGCGALKHVDLSQCAKLRQVPRRLPICVVTAPPHLEEW